MAALHLIHDAVQRGDLEIVSQRLALGASQMPNNRRLTPLLYACNQCFIKMVEHIIKRPECTKEQRIDALKILGATTILLLIDLVTLRKRLVT